MNIRYPIYEGVYRILTDKSRFFAVGCQSTVIPFFHAVVHLEVIKTRSYRISGILRLSRLFACRWSVLPPLRSVSGVPLPFPIRR